jgi:hypothetical protein
LVKTIFRARRAHGRRPHRRGFQPCH